MFVVRDRPELAFDGGAGARVGVHGPADLDPPVDGLEAPVEVVAWGFEVAAVVLVSDGECPFDPQDDTPNANATHRAPLILGESILAEPTRRP
jgi:hypothetical protein